MPGSDGPASAGLPQIYANHTGIRSGPFDVALTFGQKAGDEEAQDLARVMMSWEHAAVLVKLLQKQLEDYQAKVGPIPDLERIRSADDGEDKP